MSVRSFFARLSARKLILVYVALLIASHAVILGRSAARRGSSPPAGVSFIEVDAFGAQKGTAPDLVKLAYRRWHKDPESLANERPPVLLLHGSPSRGGADFGRLAPLLASDGRDVIAVDLPGFGRSERSVGDFSIRANAHYAFRLLDSLEIDRAHVVGWSLGGGSGIIMASENPRRIATLTLIGSIGIQEGEGSGSYHFEHIKYAIGYGLLVVLPEFVPHFGLLGPREVRHAFIRNFWDTDQRPLREMLESLSVPTLILHGRHDFLVPAWVAEEHYRLIPPSRLVMLDAGHFLPFRQAETTAGHLDVFFERHDETGVRPVHSSAVFSPAEAVDASIASFEIHRRTPWWLVILIIVAATFISEDLTVIAVGLLISQQQIDLGIGLIGCFTGIILGDIGLWALGRFVGRRILRWPLIRGRISEESLQKWGSVLDRHTGKAVFLSRCVPGTRFPTYIAAGILSRRSHHFLLWVLLAVFLWTPLLLVLTLIVGPPLHSVFERVFHGPWAIVASFIALYFVVRLIGYETTELGRQKLGADLKRITNVEFWPPWVLYAPLVPWIACLALRFRPMTFTCTNPGIALGGGIVGEPKDEIFRSISSDIPEVLPWVLIEEDGSAASRAERAIEVIEDEQVFGGFPVALKPNQGERGFGLRIARTREEVISYFREMELAVIVQRFADLPEEVGILWSRVPRAGSPADELSGEIFSITRKEFPVIVGDGQSKLEHLVWHHPRFRMQAKVFLKRFEGRNDWIPARGERVQLTSAGNHAQGTKFLDGQDLITPELSERIDQLARSFCNPHTGQHLDFGRFDVRYEDEERLRDGEGFAIIEINGTMSESTNLYEPGRPIWWRYAILFRQWTRLYRLGHRRRAEGTRPMRLRDLVALTLSHFRGRPQLRRVGLRIDSDPRIDPSP